MDDEEGRRERKKRRTRQAIADAAMRLFLERGFDAVTVADVARAADVAEKTVYNHFAGKAELFFDEGDDLLAELVHTVASRPAGESAPGALRRFLDGLPEWSEHRRPVYPTPRFRRLMADSAALQAYRRQMFARWEAALAEVLAAEPGAGSCPAEPFVVAVALVAVVRAAFEAPVGAAEAVHRDALAALALLERGLGGYATASVPIPDREVPVEDQT